MARPRFLGLNLQSVRLRDDLEKGQKFEGAEEKSWRACAKRVPDRMWLRDASIRSMKEAGTVIVFLVSSSISSFRVITWQREPVKGKKNVLKGIDYENVTFEWLV